MDIQLNIVIENRIYRECIAEYFKTVTGITVKRMFSAADHLLQQLDSAVADVIVVDSHLDNVLPLVHRVKQIQTQTKAVLIALDDVGSVVSDSVAAGVEGLVTNSDSMDDLKNCIVTVHSGRLCYPADMVRMLANGLSYPRSLLNEGAAFDVGLTYRQINVLKLIEQGYSNKVICLLYTYPSPRD